MDAGGACTTGGAGGVVSSGAINNLAYYASAGTTVTGLNTANNGLLATNGTGVPSIVATLPAANEPAHTGDVTNSAGSTVLTIPTLPVGKGGTGNTSLAANLPVIGGGASALNTGTRTGNTTQFCTASGSLISGDLAAFDSVGNIVDGGPPCNSLGDTSAAASPAAGIIGEVKSNTTSLVSYPTAGNVLNTDSVLLTAGHWQCVVGASVQPAGSTTTQALLVDIFTNNNTMTGFPNAATSGASGGAGFGMTVSTKPVMINIASSTTYFVNVVIYFAVSTIQVKTDYQCTRIW